MQHIWPYGGSPWGYRPVPHISRTLPSSHSSTIAQNFTPISCTSVEISVTLQGKKETELAQSKLKSQRYCCRDSFSWYNQYSIT